MSASRVGAHQEKDRMTWIYLLLFISGIPAMIYQIVWQRSLLALYGINIDWITIVVSAFILGLGDVVREGALFQEFRVSPKFLSSLHQRLHSRGDNCVHKPLCTYDHLQPHTL